MEEFLKDILQWLLDNYPLYLVIVIGVLMSVIFFILNFLKKPIKQLTSKIQKDWLRKLANKSIIVLSFLLGFGLWELLALVLPQYFSVDPVRVLLTGALPVIIYSFGDGVINKVEAMSAVNTIKEIVADKKVDKAELKSAEKTLDDLLK